MAFSFFTPEMKCAVINKQMGNYLARILPRILYSFRDIIIDRIKLKTVVLAPLDRLVKVVPLSTCPQDKLDPHGVGQLQQLN